VFDDDAAAPHLDPLQAANSCAAPLEVMATVGFELSASIRLPIVPWPTDSIIFTPVAPGPQLKTRQSVG